VENPGLPLRRQEKSLAAIDLVGSAGNPQAIGARVTLVTPDGKQVQQVGASEGAYLSQGHYRLYFGLGTGDKISALKIHWPDGSLEELHNIKMDTLLTIKQRWLERPNRFHTRIMFEDSSCTRTPRYPADSINR